MLTGDSTGARKTLDRLTKLLVVAARLAVFEAGRRAADLDVALECKALVVGDHFQHRRLDLLAHDHVVGGKIRRIDRDRIGGRAGRQIGFQRHRQSDQRAQIAVRRRRIERHAGGVAQAVHRQQLGGGRNRPVELEMHARRRFVRRRVGHFEQAG